jgi:hypothetical protein
MSDNVIDLSKHRPSMGDDADDAELLSMLRRLTPADRKLMIEVMRDMMLAEPAD